MCFRNDYEIELEDIISVALSVLQNGNVEECKKILEEAHNSINEKYEKEFG